MKATGIVRQLDGLGRVVLPKSLRHTLNIAEGDGLEIFVEGEKIILRKYTLWMLLVRQCGARTCKSLSGKASLQALH